MGASSISAGDLKMHCRARHCLFAVIALLGMAQLIAACGQKGDLYLPQPEPAQQPTAGTETGTVRQAIASGKAGVATGPVATSGSGQPGSEPARQTAAGADANLVWQVTTGDESAVKAEPAAASKVEPLGQE